jgi:hypothetical protein
MIWKMHMSGRGYLVTTLSQLWIQTRLVESYPKARMLTVASDSSAPNTQDSGNIDMYCTAHNLVSSLATDEVRVGEAGTPVVNLGHCLGGLVLKELCSNAAWRMGQKSKNAPGVKTLRGLSVKSSRNNLLKHSAYWVSTWQQVAEL